MTQYNFISVERDTDDPWERLLFRRGVERATRPATLAEAVVRLTQVPRVLKQVIGHTARIWERLHGEIDFDDLVAVNVLRYGAPQVFDFLLEHIDHLREQPSLADRAGGHDYQERMKALHQDWTARMTAEDVECDWPAAAEIVRHLLPHADHMFADDDWYANQRFALQGIMIDDPTDYWRRLLHEDLRPGELSDQVMLRTMDEYLKNPSATSPLVDHLVAHDQGCRLWEYFARAWTCPSLLQLAKNLIR
jgi:hypothetical protein